MYLFSDFHIIYFAPLISKAPKWNATDIEEAIIQLSIKQNASSVKLYIKNNYAKILRHYLDI